MEAHSVPTTPPPMMMRESKGTPSPMSRSLLLYTPGSSLPGMGGEAILEPVATTISAAS